MRQFGVSMQAVASQFEEVLEKALDSAGECFRYVEIGVRASGTFGDVLDTIRERPNLKYRAYAVDLFSSREFDQAALEERVRRTARNEEEARVARSPNGSVIDEIISCPNMVYGGGSIGFFLDFNVSDIDFIFVDGCHSAVCAGADIALSAVALRVNGILAVHDTNDTSQGTQPQLTHCGRPIGVKEAVSCLGLFDGKFPRMKPLKHAVAEYPQAGFTAWVKT